MANTIHIGTITKEQQQKAIRKGSREAELEAHPWTAKHKVHKSKKNYTRKDKHKGNDF